MLFRAVYCCACTVIFVQLGICRFRDEWQRLCRLIQQGRLFNVAIQTCLQHAACTANNKQVHMLQQPARCEANSCTVAQEAVSSIADLQTVAQMTARFAIDDEKQIAVSCLRCVRGTARGHEGLDYCLDQSKSLPGCSAASYSMSPRV